MSSEGERREFHQWLREPVVSLGESSIDIADLIVLALQLGWWPQFLARVERGLALQSLDLDPVAPDQIRSTATQFRYQHGLVSASEFTAWLGVRSLSVADLSGVLTRLLLRQRESGRVIEVHPDTSGVLWAEAVCIGWLAELALEAGDRLAAAHLVGDADLPADDASVQTLVAEALDSPATGLFRLGEADLRARVARVQVLEACLQRVRAQVADKPALDRCLISHKLDWLQITGEELVLDTEGAAREARMLVVVDGLPLTEAAERARAPIRPRRIMLDSAPEEAGTALVAAASGELAGPWLEKQSWRLMRVTSKVPPSADEPETRERVVGELMRDLLDRTLAGRVEWPQAL
jgi:hypothetical protein